MGAHWIGASQARQEGLGAFRGIILWILPAIAFWAVVGLILWAIIA